MSDAKDKNNDQDSFVEAFRSIPPIPKAKNEAPKVAPEKPVEKPKHQPTVTSPLEAVLMNNKPKNDFAALQTALMQALSFTSKELAMNREGEMSRKQGDRFSGKALGMLILGVLVAFLVCVTVGVIASNSPRIIAFVLAVFTGIILVAARSQIEDRRKNFKGRVVSYTGRVRKIGSDKSLQLMVINYEDQTERIFVVGANVYNAFVDGLTYTLYLPVNWEHLILSAEPMAVETRWSE